MVWVALIGRALAGEPPAVLPALDSDGYWSGRMVVPVSVAAVSALVEDPLVAARYSPDITSTEYLTRGACDTLRAETGGTIPVSYDYTRCRTADGWKETLLHSSFLSTYEVRWHFTPVSEGTQVDYGVKIGTHFPTPDFLFARQMKNAITTILGRVYRKATQ